MRKLSQSGVTLSKYGTQIVLEGPEAILTDAVVEQVRALKSDILRAFGEWDTADWKAFYDERAVIAEIGGGLPRPEAEGHAFQSCIVEWLQRHPEPSAHGRCARCGLTDRSDRVVVPFGTDNHAWLHPECWPVWHAGRRAEAIAALATMGIDQLRTNE
jgi:hypothetical protein